MILTTGIHDTFSNCFIKYLSDYIPKKENYCQIAYQKISENSNRTQLYLWVICSLQQTIPMDTAWHNRNIIN